MYWRVHRPAGAAAPVVADLCWVTPCEVTPNEMVSNGVPPNERVRSLAVVR